MKALLFLLLASAASAQVNPNPFWNGAVCDTPGFPPPECSAPVAKKPEPAPVQRGSRLRPRCPRPNAWVDGLSGLFMKDNELLGGGSVSRWDTSCTGSVYWIDEQRTIRRDLVVLGVDARELEVEDYSGTVAWLDGAAGLWRAPAGAASAADAVYLGGAVAFFALRPYTGEAVWLDKQHGLFRGATLVASDAVSFELTDPDGRIVWTDVYGQKHVIGR